MSDQPGIFSFCGNYMIRSKKVQGNFIKIIDNARWGLTPVWTLCYHNPNQEIVFLLTGIPEVIVGYN
ncbi:hypothetical protein [Sporomusa termitida]|uniref:hypothetical protein n=1 Tax=Sporomusa termitida TaxID=2377 RepID=UPI0014781CE7|nr:hypothetical protein [Sporomusa termitida]